MGHASVGRPDVGLDQAELLDNDQVLPQGRHIHLHDYFGQAKDVFRPKTPWVFDFQTAYRQVSVERSDLDPLHRHRRAQKGSAVLFHGRADNASEREIKRDNGGGNQPDDDTATDNQRFLHSGTPLLRARSIADERLRRYRTDGGINGNTYRGPGSTAGSRGH